MNHTNHPRNTNEEQPQQALNNAARAESNDGKTTKGNTGVKADREHNHRKRPGFKSRLGTMIMFFGFIWFGWFLCP
jgi:hypothetical protein